MPEQTVEDLVKEAIEGVKAMRETQTGLKTQMDALDKDKWHKAGEDASKALEDVQAINQKLTAEREASEKLNNELQTRIETLEKATAKGGTKAGVTFDIKSLRERPASDYHKSINPILRKEHDAVVVKEQAEENLFEMTKLYFPTLDDQSFKKALDLTRKSIVAGGGPDGGYFVPVERIADILTQVRETSPMRQLCRTITTATSTIEALVDDEEFAFTWGNELSVPQDDRTPKIGLISIPVHNLFARAPISENMMEDSTIDVISWISNHAAEIFGRAENTAFLQGDGINRPRGLLTYPLAADPDAYERGAIGAVDTLAASGTFAFTSDDLFNVHNHVKEAFQTGSNWLMRRRTFFNVATLKDNDGQYLTRFGDALANTPVMRLLGAPIIFADDMDVPGDGTFPIAYGNFRRAYLIVDRVGMGILRDPYTADPFTRFRFRKRVGGGMFNPDAVKLLRTRAS